ncbi:ABC transporter permease [Cohnella zeiphila]|uniref:Sugar ABC transporter permease n=1 Tax=Cohnella zeiphila TaxID=2761120 RepID=A0A7X0SSZ9_9BACL|nr:ABC transporter permease subunit [Cohnella zeiphila]MBB6735553.1 sugar ABC transporter permease [Cohnella zeiphila]
MRKDRETKKTAQNRLIKQKKGGVFSELYKHRTLYAMTLPALCFFLIFSYIPMMGVYYAFVDYDFGKGILHSPFVGLKNFQYFVSGGWDAPIVYLTKNTILYNLAFIFLGNIMQCMFAIMITTVAGRLFKRVTQSVMLLPHFVSYVIVGTIAYNIFNSNYGVLNSLLKALGGSGISVYMIQWIWPFIITFFFLWKSTGFGMVVYLAAITGFDREIYEAAKIDGCNLFKEIRYITLPMLKPTFIMLVLFSLGGIMRGQFELFYNLIQRNGQLFNVTDVLDTYIYRAMTVNFNLGTSTAAGVYQSVFGFILVVTVNQIIRKTSRENALF